MKEELDIRYSEEKDLPFLEAWFQDLKALDDFPFGPEEKGAALKNWMGFAKYRASLTATLGGAPVAIATLFLMPYKKVAHHASFYIIVDPSKRRQGVGASLLKNIVHLAKARFRLESVYAEVFSNSLLPPLLESQGFSLVFRQEGFVKIQGKEEAREVWEKELKRT